MASAIAENDAAGRRIVVGPPAGAAAAGARPVQTIQVPVDPANILTGYQAFGSTTGATTLITVPAGRTWVGEIGASVYCVEVAAGTATGIAIATLATAGTGVTPAAGTVFSVGTECGANAATGTTGSGGQNFGRMPLEVVAPAGNSVTVTVASTNAGSFSSINAFASGALAPL